MINRRATLLALLVWTQLALVWGQSRGEYAVVLSDPPLARQIASRHDLRSAASVDPASKIRREQDSVRGLIQARKIRVHGASQTLVNAIFVRASEAEAEILRGLPGVSRVEYLPPLKRKLDRAIDLVRAPAAWNVVGGQANAGAGMKIGIIDTGIDQNHPAFRDDSLPIPSGFPKGRPEDLPFTNRKVIVARSYVAQLPFADIQPVDSRPDDTTPRDRSGHGTAIAMIAAGVRNTGPAASIIGVAPKAYLGNYKVFGSPGVNDSTKTAVLVQALEDALNDGMDVVTMSVGSPAGYGPLTRTCGSNQASPCDLRADAVENAARLGLTIVLPAGNDGDVSLKFPTLNSIHTPGTAPSAITVGGSTNSHIFYASVRAGAQRINALFGGGPKPNPTLTAPVRDVSQLQDDGKACSPLGNGTLNGAIALIQRGTCDFPTKVNNAQRAGAAGVILYQLDGLNGIFNPASLAETGVPAVLIGNTDGVFLKNLVRGQPDAPATLDPALAPVDAQFDTVADFTSRGPSIGDVAKNEAPIKPELVAVATDIYTATQTFDPNGDLYDPSGYTASQGTSFAVPQVAGAVALVKQRNSGFGVGQLKSAVVNTAADEINDDDGRARVTSVGAGKLNVGAAVQVGATIEPATLSFGVIGQSSLPVSLALKLTNTGAGAASFNLAVAARDTDRNAQLTITPSSVQLSSGQSSTITVRLAGSQPAIGSYSGAITISGASTNLRVPYLYLVGDGVANDMVPILGDGFLGVPREKGFTIGFKLLDRYGVPIRSAPVRFRVASGGGTIVQGDPTTDNFGIAAAEVDLGPQLGEQQFTAEAGGLRLDFFGRARLQPVIDTNGVTNAASFLVGRGLAPGSYITIRGQGLSEATRVASTTSLPVSLAGVSVSFDAPSARLSLPGRLHFVSSGQVNVQIPWEFQGLNSVQMKVSIGEGPSDSSAVYTVPLADYSPGIFEFDDAASGRRLAAVLDQSFRVVTGSNPAIRGRSIQIYANGLGPVDNKVASGEPSQAEPLARTRVIPTVTIGGVRADVSFSGLAPGIVGLYQVNAVVPTNTQTGIQPIVITVNGIDSKIGNLIVN
jgi:minor extracellular serine protease Vpr